MTQTENNSSRDTWHDVARRPYDVSPGPHVPQRGARATGKPSVWRGLLQLIIPSVETKSHSVKTASNRDKYHSARY
ncbi:hypothetical protein [uncultured Pelagimonas sp.]|uniref:hypothetical protein n=1 Tax=uncultured Pelagimonas sp. TaxID=1618102 RepID=UPI0026389C46|nr:hypothetical protein [uncultured Pelagimonas sp.]